MVDGSFTQVQKHAFRWPERLKQAVAVCNALTLINKNHVVGDISEKEAFKAVEAQFLVSQDYLADFNTDLHCPEGSRAMRDVCIFIRVTLRFSCCSYSM